jgi:chromosome segregation ATPase
MKHVLLYTLILSTCLASCVSKKKYESLARAKRSADREIASLLGERGALEEQVNRLQVEFNAERYKLTGNNAAKEKQIDDLYSKLRARESQESALKTELQDAEEQTRHVQQTSSQRVTSLEERLKTVVAERDEARKQLAGLRNTLEEENRKLKDETGRLAGDVAANATRVEELDKEVKTLTTQLAAARKTLEDTKKELQELLRQAGREQAGRE